VVVTGAGYVVVMTGAGIVVVTGAGTVVVTGVVVAGAVETYDTGPYGTV
jgi:hypothetical protein